MIDDLDKSILVWNISPIRMIESILITKIAKIWIMLMILAISKKLAIFNTYQDDHIYSSYQHQIVVVL